MRTQSKAMTNPIQPMTQAFFLSMAVLAIYLIMITPAMAAITPTDTPMGLVICGIVNMIYGNLGRGLATLAVIIVGIGATLGKVSWGLALTVGVGVAVIFNAHTIVNNLVGVGSC